MTSTPNPQQGSLDALTFQANQIPDDTSDTDTDNGEDPTDRAPSRTPYKHHPMGKTPFDYPRPTERKPAPTTKRSALNLPADPKHINGRQLTDATRKRDRGMLEGRKSR